MKNFIYISLLLTSYCLMVSCSKKDTETAVFVAPSLPDLVHDYTKVDLSMHPDLNFNSPDGTINSIVSNEGATLGRVLFYDTKLSATNRISCGSCHTQKAGFSDLKQFSTGHNNLVTTRNSMALSNLVFMNNFFWDLRIDNLKDLVLMPIQNHIEMGMEDIDILVNKLNTIDYYPSLFKAAYGTSEINNDRISDAVAQFLRSMISLNAKYDKGRNTGFTNFTPMEELGRTLFFEKGGCVNCHNEPTFDSRWSGSAANIGLDVEYNDTGISASNTLDNVFLGNGLTAVNGFFKIPSLRNIGLTAPYMHDGRFNTLEEVVDHYNEGIQNHPSLDWRLVDINPTTGKTTPRRLQLGELEKMALVAFLNTLTDDSYIHDERFSNPFQ